MKKLLLTFAFFGLSLGVCLAQTENPAENTSPTDTVKTTVQQQTIVPASTVNPSHTSPYYQTHQPFINDANSTANMYPTAVATVDGVSLKGSRASGTAYFFNGVRVMDNMPVMRMPNPTFDIK